MHTLRGYPLGQAEEGEMSAWDELPVRFSHLRAYGRSPMHGRLARMQEAEQTMAMQRGTAVHAIIFGNRAVCGYPGPTRRGKDYDAFVTEHPDTEILTMAEFDKARQMADAVRNCDIAVPLLQGVREETIRFRWMGLDCRATPDVRGPDFITELKTAATSDPARFQWNALRMHYHAQMRMQNIACKDTMRDHYVVVVESAAPFPVTVFRIEERALEAGEKLLMLWAEKLKNCERSQQWPPYVSCIVPLDIPDEAELEFDDEPIDEFNADIASQA